VPYSVRASTALAEVCRAMAAHHYGCVLVTDDADKVVGIFTTTDALEALAKRAA
jgi:predicted transcriptional regulator